MNEIGVGEFVRRLKILLENPDSRFSFFLGAGCSVSSGIPAAGTLVRRWLPELEQRETGGQNHHDEWVKEIFPGYDGDNAARFYGEVMKKLFPSGEERQQEIERLVEGKDPGFGYAVLAQLISDPTCGRHCNIVLTTNFDDLVADALYLYTNKKPLVILHESLFSFVRIGRTRPLVLKLHGDARVQPKNVTSETKQLDEAVERVLINLLQETGLIFIGYGGNDKSIVGILEQLPGDKPPWGVYWVRDTLPESDLHTWLKDRNATWVKHLDFDELMLLIRNEFGLSHPDRSRFEELMNRYLETFKRLSSKVEAKPDSDEKKTLKKAAEKAASDFKDWLSVAIQAERLMKVNPKGADKAYQEGLSLFPNHPVLLGGYAVLLHTILNDYDKAEEYYKKAIEADPNFTPNLSNYAILLAYHRRDPDGAEEYFRRALEADPSYTKALGGYATFLAEVRGQYDEAEEYYRRAIELDPEDADSQGTYAAFLWRIRGQFDDAEEHFLRAISGFGNRPLHLSSFALFLWWVRKDHDNANKYFQKAVADGPYSPVVLGNYAGFLLTRGRPEEGFVYLEKAIAGAGDNTTLLLECRFYEYAHTHEEVIRKQALFKVRQLVLSGVRSRYWNLEDNVSTAIEDSHPHPEFLKTLAKIISDEVDAKELDKFGEWKENS